MKLSTENSQIRRKSNASAIYLHIPYLNYIFFLFQMRGAYNTVKNYYLFNKKLPSLITLVVLGIKFSFFGALGSALMYYLLLAIGVNPFGKVAAFYINLLGARMGFLGPETARTLFVEPATLLYFANFSWPSVTVSAMTIGWTYLLFGQLGAWLAYYNLKADLKRSQII
ncbi:MAG: hypothetical protein NZM25_06560 [Leptospiraceae bacterium]|nr:hypothetical protein [Leptospiraceae bacterium]MDW8306563.1 hypothetical protein [Leptospiraceae bacterium]